MTEEGRIVFEPDMELELLVGLHRDVSFVGSCSECDGTGCPCMAANDDCRFRTCEECACGTCGMVPPEEAA